MREKINNDPKTQVIIVALLVVAAAFFFVTKMGGGEEEEPIPTEATVTVAGSGESATATGASPGEAVEGAVEAVEGAATPASAIVPTSIEAPLLPAPVRAAYKADKTVVLLVVRDNGIDDKLVKRSTSALSSMSEVELFIVPVSEISRYSAITLGIEVQRVPALITMRPRSLSEGTPQASVIYGYQTSQTIVQAARDASYEGPVDTYHPD